MQLPTFRSSRARKHEVRESRDKSNSDRTLTSPSNGVDVKRATKTRKTWILISCLFFLLSVIFLILAIIGNINRNPVIRDTWFFKLDLANIIPASAGTSLVLVNSLARSLGLHDFYLVGLWNFCEGYNDEGVTYCSPTQTLYWFNPVEILLNELLAGATIVLPGNINDILDLIRFASNVMFGCFMTGVCMNFISIFIAPVTLYSRWWSLPFTIWSFIAALLSSAAAIIATVMFTIFRNVITSQEGINIGASLGNVMFGFMWTGAAFSILGFVIHVCLSCCCASRRDVRSGRKKGSRHAYEGEGMVEKKGNGNGKRTWPAFGKQKSEAEVV